MKKEVAEEDAKEVVKPIIEEQPIKKSKYKIGEVASLKNLLVNVIEIIFLIMEIIHSRRSKNTR